MPAYEVGLMATKIARAPHMFPPSSTKMTMKLPLMAAQQNFFRFRDNPFRFWQHYSTKVAEQAPDQLSATDEEELSDYGNPAQIKRDLYAALQGINRGLFGVPSAKKSEIGKLVELLESQNPTPEPALCLEKVAGVWKLIFSTITILGSRRTKLGLRDFINLGDFFQSIDLAEVCITLFYNARPLKYNIKIELKGENIYSPKCVLTCPGFVMAMEGKAVNVIKFSARGLTLLSGQLTIEASFKCTSTSRVDIRYNKSIITPDQLMNVFRKNYDLLLDIFNPEGWLEITYVDDSLRIGRDDKGNIFILERIE